MRFSTSTVFAVALAFLVLTGPWAGLRAAHSNKSGQEVSDAPNATVDGDKKREPGTGWLVGRATFRGKPVPPRRIQVTKDVEFCEKAAGEHQEVVVSEAGGLAGVVIEVLGVKPLRGEWTWEHPQDGYVLRQKHCGFEPRLLVIPNGAEVKVFNDDPIAHNANSGQWNIIQAKGAEPFSKPISSRQPARITCNIHSWMEAWVYPAQSPMVAVSDKEGNFRVANVAPGKYRGVAWHPSLRRQRLRVTIEADKETRQDVEFESPVK